MDIIRQLEEEQKKDSVEEISVGDYVKIDYRIKEDKRKNTNV